MTTRTKKEGYDCIAATRKIRERLSTKSAELSSDSATLVHETGGDLSPN